MQGAELRPDERDADEIYEHDEQQLRYHGVAQAHGRGHGRVEPTRDASGIRPRSRNSRMAERNRVCTASRNWTCTSMTDRKGTCTVLPHACPFNTDRISGGSQANSGITRSHRCRRCSAFHNQGTARARTAEVFPTGWYAHVVKKGAATGRPWEQTVCSVPASTTAALPPASGEGHARQKDPRQSYTPMQQFGPDC